ncbi:hypothetical protein G6F55_006644 [Rhizopus delemar]|nr:hypothetical protein G6F55_006644 [Rhizopus delemar]KAG1509329.1 hypothetical protein G6F53_007527 [Rhizopus delemar]KAG1553615.1 hypothetical protein G6F49_008308 [Rhizopus delemar]KAG1567995.1 hypothetical protein G6F50_007697 [Rhizopus delemar]
MDLDSINEEQNSSKSQSLNFKHSLLKRRGLKTQELQQLLTELAQKLKRLEQGAVDQQSLATVAKELINSQILKNKSNMNIAISACCLADILRLYAPEAPYNQTELRDIFIFFVQNLSHFSKEDKAFEHRFYLLESLATVKSFIIISELDQVDDIIIPVFDEFFKASANTSLPRNVQVCMTDILIQIVDEVGVSGQEVVELIFEQFVKHEKTPTIPAYIMAAEICSVCAPILQRKTVQYFSGALLSASNANGTEELEELRKAHYLIIKVNDVVPELLQTVFPLIQEEMKLDQPNVRQLATETMGKLFAHPDANLTEKYPAIWKTWLGRRNDRVTQLRAKWLEMSVGIYKNHPELANDLADCIKMKLSDPDEKVRSTACKTIEEIILYSDLKQIDKSMLESVEERTKDKKNSVRVQAMRAIGSIYNKWFNCIQANDEVAIQKLGWVPKSLLNRMYTGDASVTMALEDALITYIFPYDENEQQRAERLVVITETLEQRQKIAFTAIIRKQKKFNDDMHKYLKMCEDMIDHQALSDYDTKKNDEFMKYLAAHFSDKPRTLNALRTLFNRKSSRDANLLKSSIRVDSNYKQIYKAKNELLYNLNEDQAGSVEIFQTVLNRACLALLDKSCIPYLLKIAKNQKTHKENRGTLSKRVIASRDILKEISVSYPIMYEECMNDLVQGIAIDNDSTTVEELEIIAEISKSYPAQRTYERNVIKRLWSYVLDGAASEARFSSIILGNMENADVILADLVDKLCDELSLSHPRLLATLTCLSQFASYTHNILTPVVGILLNFIEKNLLSAATKTIADSNPEWVAYEALPELSKQKIIGVRLLVNYLAACKDKVSLEEHITTRAFAILYNLLESDCDNAFANKTR